MPRISSVRLAHPPFAVANAERVAQLQQSGDYDQIWRVVYRKGPKGPWLIWKRPGRQILLSTFYGTLLMLAWNAEFPKMKTKHRRGEMAIARCSGKDTVNPRRGLRRVREVKRRRRRK